MQEGELIRKGGCIWKSNFAISLHVFSNFEMVLTMSLISNTFANQQWHNPVKNAKRNTRSTNFSNNDYSKNLDFFRIIAE